MTIADLLKLLEYGTLEFIADDLSEIKDGPAAEILAMVAAEIARRDAWNDGCDEEEGSR